MNGSFRRISALLVLLVAAAPTAQAQHRGNGGRIPSAPSARPGGGAMAGERFPGGQIDARPHVAGDQWYGHAPASDARYNFAGRPFANGRLTRFGPTSPYRIQRFNAPNHQLWLSGGLGFDIAAADWPFASTWCFSCPDDIIAYEDPTHPGWYLLYNSETGVYVHARYLGM